VRLAEEKFAALASGEAPAPLPAQYVGGESREVQDLEQAHFVCAFPGVSHADPDYYAAQVYVTALGGGMSSRLFQEARERRGLCYTIYAFTHCYQDGGVVGVYAGTGEQEAAEIAPVIAGEMAAMAANANESEIARAKAQLKSSLLMGLERPGNRAEQIAASMFAYGRVVSPEEIIRKLDAVDIAAVRAFAARVMTTVAPSVAAIGPVTKLESHEKFAARFGGANVMRAAE
jgi:predicted Zn-dependent peptidase